MPFDLTIHQTTLGVVAIVEHTGERAQTRLLAHLTVRERAQCAGMKLKRRIDFAGGRVALRQACAAMGVTAVGEVDLLADVDGVPALPSGVSGSISHSGCYAIALVGWAADGALGIDVETRSDHLANCMSYVLTKHELNAITGMLPAAQLAQCAWCFSLKESLYKAVFPRLRRHVDFAEAAVDLPIEVSELSAPFSTPARLSFTESVDNIEARCHRLGSAVVAACRVGAATVAEPGARLLQQSAEQPAMGEGRRRTPAPSRSPSKSRAPVVGGGSQSARVATHPPGREQLGAPLY